MIAALSATISAGIDLYRNPGVGQISAIIALLVTAAGAYSLFTPEEWNDIR